MKYLVIIEECENNFSAYSPDLPGCITTGKTRNEILANMKEAIEFHLEGLQKDGIDISPPKSTAEYILV